MRRGDPRRRLRFGSDGEFDRIQVGPSVITDLGQVCEVATPYVFRLRLSPQNGEPQLRVAERSGRRPRERRSRTTLLAKTGAGPTGADPPPRGRLASGGDERAARRGAS